MGDWGDGVEGGRMGTGQCGRADRWQKESGRGEQEDGGDGGRVSGWEAEQDNAGQVAKRNGEMWGEQNVDRERGRREEGTGRPGSGGWECVYIHRERETYRYRYIEV